LGALDQLAEEFPLAAKASRTLLWVSIPDPGGGACCKVSFEAAGELRKAPPMGEDIRQTVKNAWGTKEL
jgi:hypothetical protein